MATSDFVYILEPIYQKNCKVDGRVRLSKVRQKDRTGYKIKNEFKNHKELDFVLECKTLVFESTN